MPVQTAAAAGAFTQSLGVNTHINFYGGPYGNQGVVINALNYLGLANVRDSAGPNDINPWKQVAAATGVHFDDFVGEVPPSDYGAQLDAMRQLDSLGLLNAIEGANEPDAAYAVSIGESVGSGATLQHSVWQLGQELGLPVINMSFGSVEDYGSSGDLSAWTDYANAHTYFGTGNNPAWVDWIGTLNGWAQSSAASRPPMITETGYYTSGNGSDPSNVSETVQAKYTLDLVLDAWQSGAARTYLYELLDQGTGDGNSENNFGLFHSDGTPKPAADALHNLTTLLNDPGGTQAAGGSLDYSLSGLQDADHTELLQKSDGSYWLAVWNDTRLSGPFDAGEIHVPPHSVTLTLASPASSIQVFDPLTGTSPVQSASGTDSLTFDVPDHPVLVEIGGTGGAPASEPGPATQPEPTPGPTPAPSPQPPANSDGAQQIAPDDAAPLLIANNADFSASAGDHAIFIVGTGNTLTANGGTETVQAYQGGNAITTGAGDDTLRFAGSGNTIDAGGGSNRLEDSGSGNTIVLPAAGQGYDDVFGWTMQNGDTFDLRPALAQTGWNGDLDTLGDFVQVATNGNDGVISIDPAGTGGASGSPVASLYTSGSIDLSTLLAHALVG